MLFRLLCGLEMLVKNTNNQELAKLLLSGIAGNQTDYAKFLGRAGLIIRKIVVARIASSAAEDIVQEVLISIHKARHTYDGMRPILPWLVSITRFRITDYLRKYYSSHSHLTSDIKILEDVLADVTESIGTNESVDELLENTPEKHKKILTMMHVEGYTAKEIGKQLKMNESAVKVAAHRAIKKIREKFGT